MVSKSSRHAAEQSHMGTVFRITAWMEGDPVNAFRAAFARVAELDASLSDYNPASELNRLCRSGGGEAGPDLLAVLAVSQRFAHETGGAFDVTQGPVIRLWREARRSGRLPEPGALIDAADRSGYRNLEIEGRRVRMLVPGMQLDLGGVAKGYAADEALRVLRLHGVNRALVAASGDLAMGDAPPDKAAWSVGYESLKGAGKLALANCAVSTSGDTEQYAEIGGERFSHILDPHTHRPLSRRVSVTVVAPSATEADGLATAISVLGAARGFRLLQTRSGVSALIATEDGEQASAGWPGRAL